MQDFCDILLMMGRKAKETYTKMAEKLEFLNLEELIPYENNTKIHKQFQVDQIINSIKEFGFTNPILISKENGIIAGHGRLMAAKRLHMEKVPVIRLDYLTEQQQRAYIIADNKIAENAEWNLDLLAQELQALDGLDFDVSLLGFSDDELDNFLNQDVETVGEQKEIENNFEPPNDPITKPGDVWILGDHRLICGSCTEIDIYRKLTQGVKIDMVLTDPPYGIDYESKREDMNKRARNKGGIAHEKIANDTGKDYRQFFAEFLSLIEFQDYNTVYCFLSGKELHNLRLAFEDCNITWSSYLVWLKNSIVMNRRDYNSKFEFICFGWKGRHKFYGPTNACDILEFNRPLKANLHSTMKPINLLEELLSHGSKRNMVIYEPFAGSGSTLIACENKGRKCLASELESKYCDVIVKRWQELTGRKGILEATGEEYDKLTASDRR